MKKRLIVAMAATAAIAAGLGAGSFAWFTSTAVSGNNSFETGTLHINKAGADTWLSVGGNSITLENMKCGDQNEYKYAVDNTDENGNVSTLDFLYKSNVTSLFNAENGTVHDGEKIYAANAKKANLANAALFDLTLTRSGGADGFPNSSDSTYRGIYEVLKDGGNNTIGGKITFDRLDYTELLDVLALERKMNGKAKVTDTYDLMVTLPNQIFGGLDKTEAGKTALECSSPLAGTEYNTSNTGEDNDYQGAPGGFVINTYAAQNIAGAAYKSSMGDDKGSVGSTK